jgi:hypothetical protein
MQQIGDVGKILGPIVADARKAIDTVNAVKKTLEGANPEQLGAIVNSIASDLQPLVSDGEEESKTTDTGQVVQSTGVPGSPIPGSSPLAQKMTTESGVIFRDVASVAGGISMRKSKVNITSASDAINRMSGNRFVMNNTMKGIEQTMNSLESTFTRLRMSDKRIPDSSYSAKYPYNQVSVSKSGHEQHIDDTPEPKDSGSLISLVRTGRSARMDVKYH